MNYQHIFHAGNFADVCKHNILIALLANLQRKETPFCYLETHAGRGCYNLQASEAQKTLEYKNGIERLWTTVQTVSTIRTYLDLVKSYHSASRILKNYPGSPCLVSSLLRPQDRAILMELHPQEVFALKNAFHRNPQIAVHHLDGYQGIKAFLPPKEKRGLLFVDPPFERQTPEFDHLVQVAQFVQQRWLHGVVAIWYPIKERFEITRFHQQLRNTGVKKVLICELCIFPDDSTVSLNGSGMVILNAPWQFDSIVTEILTALRQQMAVSPFAGKVDVFWLVNE